MVTMQPGASETGTGSQGRPRAGCVIPVHPLARDAGDDGHIPGDRLTPVAIGDGPHAPDAQAPGQYAAVFGLAQGVHGVIAGCRDPRETLGPAGPGCSPMTPSSGRTRIAG